VKTCVPGRTLSARNFSSYCGLTAETGSAIVLSSLWTSPTTAVLPTGSWPWWLFARFVFIAFFVSYVGLVNFHYAAQKFKVVLL